MNIATLSSTFAQWPMDWVILGVFAGIVAIDALRSGTGRAAALALAAPLALMLNAAFPQTAILGSVLAQLTTDAAQALLFGAIFVLLFLAIYRIVYSFSEADGVVQGLIAGVAAAVSVVIVWIQVPALQSLWHFGPQVQLVFGEAYRLWWLAAALLALAFVRG